MELETDALLSPLESEYVNILFWLEVARVKLTTPVESYLAIPVLT